MPTEKEVQAVRDTIEKWKGDRLGECALCEVWECYDKLGNDMIFTSGCPLGTRSSHCDIPSSPYRQYESAIDRCNTKEENKQAKRIVNACNRWLKKHGLNETVKAK